LSSDKYIVLLTDTFEREFKKKHRERYEWLSSVINRLELSPQDGKPLRGRLHGTWQLRMGPFRLWYEINDEEKKVILKAILHKDDAKKYY
jgi:mRNA interferase RelE/StbE